MQERMQDINEGGKDCGTIQETMQEAGQEIPAVFPGGGTLRIRRGRSPPTRTRRGPWRNHLPHKTFSQYGYSGTKYSVISNTPV